MKTISTHPIIKIMVAAAVIVALFTGFGNMPLYGRYYVADMPGLAWSGNFFTNVYVHILAGSLLLGIGIHAITITLLAGSKAPGRLTGSGKIRGALLTLTLATGILMVIKNLPGVQFPLQMLMIANFTHMGAAVLFIFTTLIMLIFRKPWTTAP